MTTIQNLKWIVFWISVVVTLTCLAGCSVPSPAPAETPLPTITPSSTARVSSTLELPAQTRAAPSPTPTVTSSPTPHPTRTPRPTPRPTLTADEEYTYVREMLATNAGCELPCWWGITPGESDWQEAMDQLSPLYFQFWFLEEDRYDVHLNLAKAKDVVESIHVSGYCPHSMNECFLFAQDWSGYSLDWVMERYGPPSRARIVFPPTIEAGAPIYYNLYVLYDDLGFSIAYTGAAIERDKILLTCFSFYHIRLWLQPPGSLLPLLEQGISPEAWDFAVPLEEATGMSLEEFYETFRHPGACLETAPTFP